MKIALLTIHYAYNYGAMLQAYALQKYLEDQGVSCEIINYISSKQLLEYRLFHSDFNAIGMLRNIRNLLTLRTQLRRKKEFKKFRNENFHLTSILSTVNELKALLPKYDICIIGSDQTWNIRLNAYDEAYLLPFKTKTIKAAYAPSMGDKLSIFSNDDIRKMSQWIDDFMYISVREKETACYLQPYVNKQIETVVDPTLLLSNIDWDEIAKKSKRKAFGFKEKYILFYTVKSNSQVVKYCKNLAKHLNLKVICIHPYNQFEIGMHAIRDIAIGPAEFIHYIKYAEYVCTTSFHATVFSVLYHKKLFCPTDNRRVTQFLCNIGLNESIIDLQKPNYVIGNPVWSNVDNCIQEMKLKSTKYLAKIIHHE